MRIRKRSILLLLNDLKINTNLKNYCSTIRLLITGFTKYKNYIQVMTNYVITFNVLNFMRLYLSFIPALINFENIFFQ
jgi:hypothetical protein